MLVFDQKEAKSM